MADLGAGAGGLSTHAGELTSEPVAASLGLPRTE